jgi:hypothetical protein
MTLMMPACGAATKGISAEQKTDESTIPPKEDPPDFVLGIGTEYFVTPLGTGSGSESAPFGSIQAALNAAQAGDVITILPGTYAEAIRTVRNGMDSARITLRSRDGHGSVIVTAAGRVFDINHPYIQIKGLIFDGQYGANDLIRVTTAASNSMMLQTEVRRSGRDCIDMNAPSNFLIDQSLVHHCLWWSGVREDAHGIVSGAVQNLQIRNTEVHSFSGDAFQADPGRAAPGWNNVTIENCHFWLEPLPQAANGYLAGMVPGENAVDTKTLASAPRARLNIINTVMHGFRGGISNMAALNMKEKIEATIDRVTIYDSEIAFRLRGITSTTPGAWVKIKNAVVYDVDKAVRYEDNVESMSILNSTFGRQVTLGFQDVASGSPLDVRNLLVLGASLPPEAPASLGNLATQASSFINSTSDDYHLTSQSPAIDRGVMLSEVTNDRDDRARPQGTGHDIGAFEY